MTSTSAPTAADGSSDVDLRGWTPSINPADVDPFSGSLSWGYDFNLPPAPGGFRPELQLTYNSRRVDALLGFGQSDWVGYGWALDAPEIMRPNVGVIPCDIGCSTTEYYIHRDDDYLLVMGGASSRLVDAGGGVWRAADDAFARIIKNANDSWEVTLRDGTRYLLGTTTDSKVTVTGHLGSSFTSSRSTETLRYRAKQFIFSNGVVVTYSYDIVNATDQCNTWTTRTNSQCLQPSFYDYSSQRESYLKQIEYPGTKIVFNRSRRWDLNELNTIGNDGARINAYYFWGTADTRWPVFYQTDALRSVELQQQRPSDNQWETTRRWQFTYSRYVPVDCQGTGYFGCPTTSDPIDGLSSINMRILSVFQEIAVADGVQTSLPNYVFGYMDKPNRDQNGYYHMIRYHYPRLGSVTNGIGGLIQVDYDSPDVGVSLPKYYRITTRDTIQAGGSILNRERYVYSAERCFTSRTNPCHTQNNVDIDKDYVYQDEFRGYREVTMTVMTGSDVASRQEWTRFSFGEDGRGLAGTLHAIGRPLFSEVRSGSGSVLQRTADTWLISPTVSGAAFVGLYARVITDTSANRATETDYRYDIFGNTRAILEYGSLDVSGDERSTVREFRPVTNTSAGTVWMVDRPAREAVFAAITEDINDSHKQTETRYYYDGASTWNTPPSGMGLLTQEEQGPGASGWATKGIGYDAWGNTTVVTDANGVKSTTGYDSSGRFVLTQTNGLTQTTRYEYVGVNGNAPIAGSAHFGMLKRSIAPNGMTIDAVYDAQGRLSDVVRLPDTISVPSLHYAYDNSDWPAQIIESFTSGVGNWSGSNVTWAQNQGISGSAIRISNGTGASGGALLYYSGSSPLLDAKSGYRFSVWVKGTGQICFRFGVYSGGPNAPLGCIMATGTWQRFSGYTSMPDYHTYDGATAWLAYDTSAGADILLDEVTWSKATGAPFKVETWRREQTGCAACARYELSFYDALGRVVQQRSPGSNANQQNVVNDEYDVLGRKVNSYAPVAETYTSTYVLPAGWNTRPKTQTQYDALSRPLVVTNTDGTTTQMAYLGMTTIVTDANGHRKDNVSDAYGRLQTVVEYSGTAAYTTTYSYDALNNLTRVVDALGNTTVITYDALGRKTAMADPDMGVWAYGYDTNGNLITQTDALSQTLWFKYDGLNRLIEKRLSGESGTLLSSYGYDQGANGIGRRTSAWNANASTSLGYDIRGRVISQSNSIAGVAGDFTTVLAYDAADRVVTVTHPSGEVVTTSYNLAGQAIALGGWNGYVSSANYNALGQPTQIRFGNGLDTRYRYFGLDYQVSGNSNQFYGRLRQSCVVTQGTSGCIDGGTPGALLDLAYWYDNNSNITTISDRTRSESLAYAYDPLDRLLGVSGGYTETYAYTPIGNFVSKAGVTQYYSSTKPHAVTSLSNGSSFVYDSNGNMTSRAEVSGTQRITYTQAWDVDNRLIDVISGTQHTQFYYDSGGTLVKKVDPRGTTAYVGGDDEIAWLVPTQTITITIPATLTHKLYFPMVAMNTLNAVNGISTTYYRFNGRRVAMRTGSNVYWLHGDHLGSASLVTSITGTKVSELRYKPYGETRYSSGNTPTDKRFTSQEEQAGIGLYSYGARFYVPAIGRFLSADSIVPQPGDPQSLNRYTYVRNSALMYTDPTGHYCAGAVTWMYSYSYCYNPGQAASSSGSGWGVAAAFAGATVGIAALSVNQASDQAQGVPTQNQTQQPNRGSSKFTPPPGPPNGPDPRNYKDLNSLLKAAIAAAVAEATADGDPTNEVRGVTASLGRFPQYIQEAQQLGLKYYQIPDAVYGKLEQLGGRGAQWQPNQAFLDGIIKRGEAFRWASNTDPTQLKAGSWSATELNYLLSNGYKLWFDGHTFFSSALKLFDSWSEVPVN